MPPTSDSSVRTRSLALFSGLFLVAVAVYAVMFVIDFTSRGAGLWDTLLSADNVEVLINTGEITVSVLGVVITVVALTLELAATRYSPRIPTMFLRDRTHQAVLAFYVVASALVVWFNLSLHGTPLPRAMFFADIALLSAVILSVLPYFAYLFDFVSPNRFVARMSEQACAELVGDGQGGKPAGRSELMATIAQLGEIARQSVEAQDRAIAVAAISALVDVGAMSVERKRAQPPAWFEAFDLLRADEDFVAWHRDVLHRVQDRRTFVELKVLRQLQSIYTSCAGEADDLTHLVAIQTRRLAIRAAECGDGEVTRLCVRFLNTFFRTALNARDVRGGYNLLNEYRILADALLHTGDHDVVIEVARHMQGYGWLGFKAKLPFLLETAAYDLCVLLEAAHAVASPEHDALLGIFLSVDREQDGEAELDAALRGVRKAQVKLATYYLEHGEEQLARRISADMQTEDRVRLRGLVDELARTTEEEFWEVSDRGANFDWLAPDRRVHLKTFLAWLS